MRIPTIFTPELQRRHYRIGRLLALAGGLIFAASAYLPWAYASGALDDMTYLGGPSTLQFLGLVLGLILAICAAMGLVEPWAGAKGVAPALLKVSKRVGWTRAAKVTGIGNINGAVVGGLTLGVVEAMATSFIPGQFGGPSWKDVWAFVLLILILVFRPQGLVGAKVVDRA